MRNDFVNLFWTGKLPKETHWRYLSKWQKYLSDQNSHFCVRLWVTDDLFRQMKSDSKFTIYTDDCLTLNVQSSHIQINNIQPLIQQSVSVENYPYLVAFYMKLIDANLYSFASSFARMVILNSEPGFYIDFDMQPCENAPFPKSLSTLRDSVRSHLGGGHNYNGAFCYYNGVCVENQVMLTLSQGAFSSSLREYNNQISSDPQEFFSSLNLGISNYQAIISRPKKLLADDPFLQEKQNQVHLERFKMKDDTDLYSELCEFTTLASKDEQLIKDALDLFQKFYRISICSYDHAVAAKTYPSVVNIINSCFKNPTQDKKLVYVWSHPIHFNLSRLQTAANTISQVYQNQKEKRIAKLQEKKRLLFKAAEDGNKDYIENNYKLLQQSELQSMIKITSSHQNWQATLFLMNTEEMKGFSHWSSIFDFATAFKSTDRKVMDEVCSSFTLDHFISTLLEHAIIAKAREWFLYVWANYHQQLNETEIKGVLSKAIQYCDPQSIIVMTERDEALQYVALKAAIESDRYAIISALLTSYDSLVPDENSICPLLYCLLRNNDIKAFERFAPESKTNSHQLEKLIDYAISKYDTKICHYLFDHNKELFTENMIHKVASSESCSLEFFTSLLGDASFPQITNKVLNDIINHDQIPQEKILMIIKQTTLPLEPNIVNNLIQRIARDLDEIILNNQEPDISDTTLAYNKENIKSLTFFLGTIIKMAHVKQAITQIENESLHDLAKKLDESYSLREEEINDFFSGNSHSFRSM